MIATRLPAALAGAVLVVALAGCSALAPDGKVQACATLAGKLPDISSQLQSAGDTLQSDPAAAVEQLKEAKSTFDATVADLKNAEIKSAAESASSSLGDLTTKLEAAAANPTTADPAELQTALTTTRTQFSALADTCSKLE